MTAVTKAVLLNIGAFLADNNIRRSIGAFTYNFTSPTAGVVVNNFTLNPGETLTWNTPMAQSAMTFLSCSENITADFTFSVASATAPYQMNVSKVHLVDSDVRQMVVTNPGTSASKLVIIQA